MKFFSVCHVVLIVISKPPGLASPSLSQYLLLVANSDHLLGYLIACVCIVVGLKMGRKISVLQPKASEDHSDSLGHFGTYLPMSYLVHFSHWLYLQELQRKCKIIRHKSKKKWK